ncbi:MAG: hypothetical protein ABW133_03810 [Polyangiaceae bacterium]
MKTMLHEIRSDVMITVQGDVPLADDDWDEYLNAVEAAPNIKAFLISADNYGPNARQRAKLQSHRTVYPHPKAVVTTSMAVRGIVTATSWLGTNIRAFSPDRIDEAFDYLRTPADLRPSLLECLALMKTRLAGGDAIEQFRMPAVDNASDLALMHQIVEERVANIRAKLRSAPRR